MLAFFLRPSSRIALRTSFGVMTLLAVVAACSDDGSPGGGDGDDSGSGGSVEQGDGDGDAPGGSEGDGDGDIPVYTPTGDPCEFGDDSEKCDAESSVACTPVLGTMGVTCDDDDDCGADELCFSSIASDSSEGFCMRLYGECLSVCDDDSDCGAGSMCNRRTGACIDEGDTGWPLPGDARFGESCTSSDDCAGSCVQISDEVFECEEYCRVGAVSGCGVEDLSESAVACAYFAFDLSDFDADQGAGDVGICANLCDCTADCPGQQKCLPRPLRGHAGVCTGGVVEDEITACPDVSGGGAGGSEGP